jgi:hypothetical protein
LGGRQILVFDNLVGRNPVAAENLPAGQGFRFRFGLRGDRGFVVKIIVQAAF